MGCKTYKSDLSTSNLGRRSIESRVLALTCLYDRIQLSGDLMMADLRKAPSNPIASKLETQDKIYDFEVCGSHIYAISGSEALALSLVEDKKGEMLQVKVKARSKMFPSQGENTEDPAGYLKTVGGTSKSFLIGTLCKEWPEDTPMHHALCLLDPTTLKFLHSLRLESAFCAFSGYDRPISYHSIVMLQGKGFEVAVVANFFQTVNIVGVNRGQLIAIRLGFAFESESINACVKRGNEVIIMVQQTGLHKLTVKF